MANTSIFAAFERMWQHVVALVGSKADSGHTHDDMYYTEAEIDDMLQDVASESVINSKVNEHNTSTLAHNDIRTLISDLSTAVNNFLDVDDTTTDQLSEVLTLINNNKGTLESLTTSKVNVADIIDNLTTNSTSKVLSAAQGVVIKGLIDALQSELDTKMNQTDPTGAGSLSMNRKSESEIGAHSTTTGYSNTASGQYSEAHGFSTVASNHGAHAEGDHTTASGYASHSEGLSTNALGRYTHAEGYKTTADAMAAHAEGYDTKAIGVYQHVQGKYNVTSGTHAHIVGNGESDTDRSNAHTIDWEGNAWFAGDVYVGSTGGIDKDNGSKKLATEEYADSVASNKADKSLTVNVTKSGTTFSADTTFSVISAAIDNNTAVYVKYNNTIYYPALKTAALITFRSHGSSSEDIINIMSSDVVTAAYSSLPVATEDSLGGIKSGGDISVGTDGIVTVNPSVVQEAYDLANTANTTANAALPKSGGTMTGNLTAAANNTGTTAMVRNIAYGSQSSLTSFASTANNGTILIYTS